MIKRLALAGAFLGFLSAAQAGTSTITTKDASGVTKTFFVTTDGSGNFYSAGVICDQAAAAICASVGTAGSPSTNALTVQPVTLGHGAAGNAARVELPTDGTGQIATVSAVTAITNALPAGTNKLGTIDPATIATWGLAAIGGTTGSPTNALAAGCQYNASPPTFTTGDVGGVQCNINGSLHTTVDNTIGSLAWGDGVSATSAGSLVSGMSFLYNGSTADRRRSGGVTGMAGVSGDTASGSSNAGNPLQNGGRAATTEPIAVTNGQRVGATFDLSGKQVVQPYTNRENALSCAATITASTAATTCTGMGAQGAGVKIYITDLCATRSDAGTTAATMTLNDAATTIIDMPNNGGGGGFCKTYNTPLVVAANTAFQGTSGTSLTSVHLSASGFKGY